MAYKYFKAFWVVIFYFVAVCASTTSGAPTGERPESKSTKKDSALLMQPLIITWPKDWPASVTFNSQCKKVDKQKIVCSKADQGEYTFTWDGMWRAVLDLKNLKGDQVFMDLSKLTLIWPQQIGLLLNTDVQPDACLTGPGYNKKVIWYCPGERYDQEKCRSDIDVPKGDYSLNAIDWSENGLPKSVFIDLHNNSFNSNFEPQVRIKLPLENPSSPLIQRALKKRNVNPTEDPEVEYDTHAKLLEFESRDKCRNGEENSTWSVYTSIGLSELQIRACSWVKAVKDGQDRSMCTQAKVDEDMITFQLESNEIAGKRLVIVVARDISLDREGIGSAIQSVLSTWIKKIKSNGRHVPFNLLTIEGDGTINQVLRGEDLATLEFNSNIKNPLPTVAGILESKVTFNAGGFRPLKDLEFVERTLYGLGITKIKSVLFITGGDLRDKEKIFNAELGTPLGWRNESVDLNVVTNGGCGPWKKQAKASSCIELKTRKEVDKILHLLKKYSSV